MGRGRQRAKAARQARDIKYFSPETDLSALERELGAAKQKRSTAVYEDDYPDPDYSDYADKYADYED